jgi:hypothetical protein
MIAVSLDSLLDEIFNKFSYWQKFVLKHKSQNVYFETKFDAENNNKKIMFRIFTNNDVGYLLAFQLNKVRSIISSIDFQLNSITNNSYRCDIDFYNTVDCESVEKLSLDFELANDEFIPDVQAKQIFDFVDKAVALSSKTVLGSSFPIPDFIIQFLEKKLFNAEYPHQLDDTYSYGNYEKLTYDINRQIYPNLENIAIYTIEVRKVFEYTELYFSYTLQYSDNVSIYRQEKIGPFLIFCQEELENSNEINDFFTATQTCTKLFFQEENNK